MRLTSPLVQPVTESANGGSPVKALSTQSLPPGNISESSKQTTADLATTLRVNVEVLESLVNLAGELVLSRNQLREALASNDMRGVNAGTQRVSLVTSELQEAIMQTRMQPIGNVFSKFPRIVRDLSKEQGKDIQLLLEGKEVEMDKTLLEGLNDPLTHMIRNACDHGIETPEVRRINGKPPSGKIFMRAFHEAGQVVVEITDDGKGIDPTIIASKAISKGLVSAEKVLGMSDSEKKALIFLPGLSTSEVISDVSGRGVGMDVVKANLDRLGGKIEIDSEVNRGTRFCIKLPLTMAIIPSLVVAVSGERFAIPQINVLELTRIPAAEICKRVEIVSDAEVMTLRGKLIPLVSLAKVLGIKRNVSFPETGETRPDQRQGLADRRSTKYRADGTTQAETQAITHRELTEKVFRIFFATLDAANQAK